MDMVRKSFLFTAKTNLYHALGFIFTYADLHFQMRNIFKSYAKTLEKIAHLMPPDLNRFLDQESQVDVNFCNLLRVMNYRGYMYMKAIR